MPLSPRMVLLVMASWIRSWASGFMIILSFPTPRTFAASLRLLLRFNNSQPLRIQYPEAQFRGPLHYLRSLPGANGASDPDHFFSWHDLRQVMGVVHQHLRMAAWMIVP